MERKSLKLRYTKFRREHPKANAVIMLGVLPSLIFLTSAACTGTDNSIHKCPDGLPPIPLTGKCPDTRT